MCRAAAPRHVRLAVMFALALPAAGLATDRPEQDAVEQASDVGPGTPTPAAIQSAGSEPTERVDQQVGSAPRAAVVQNKEAPALPQDAATLARSRQVEQRVMAEVYGGLVIDQTLSPNGREFYRSFVAAWTDRPRVDRYALVVRERPTPRQDSHISIDQGLRRVFQGRLPTRRGDLSEYAARVAEATYQFVGDAELQAQLFRDPDLAREELQ